MKYTYKCNLHGEFISEEPMKVQHETALCFCGIKSPRVWEPTNHIWEPYDNPNHPERRGSDG